MGFPHTSCFLPFSPCGNVIGKTATDISAIHDLLIVPLESELNQKRKIELEEAFLFIDMCLF
jgi:hypothetical protein